VRERAGSALRWCAGVALHWSLTAADWVVALADRIDPLGEDGEPRVVRDPLRRSDEDRAFEGFVPVTESMSDLSDMAPQPRRRFRQVLEESREEPLPGSVDERLKRLRRIR
jgi:hypothetical protein